MAVELAYEDFGDGPPMVILHGLFGSARNWRTLARRFAESHRVYALDLRNHGASPNADGMTFEDMVSDLEAFLAARHIDDAVVVGHSLGGKTAMLYALAHPERVDALVVIDIAPVAYEHTHLPVVRALQALDLRWYERRSEVEQALIDPIPDAEMRAFLMQSLEAGPEGLRWRLHLDAIARHMDALTGFPDVSGLAYDGRALFVSGANSDYVGPATHDAIFALFPQAEFAVIPEAGHRVHADQPDAFLARVRDFLDSAYA